MKFEKISENQIRCTLDSKDFSELNLKLSELAYGSDKANALFHDMIQKASDECNFKTEDMPVMIEAIPLAQDSLVVLITKVSDPDELDNRFSNFTAPPAGLVPERTEPEIKHYADEILNCCDHLGKLLGDKLADKLLPGANGIPVSDDPLAPDHSDVNIVRNLSKVYSFDSFEAVISLAHLINRFYHGENTLFKDPKTGRYYLAVNLSEHTASEFNKVCNIISEYGQTEQPSSAGYSFYEEHYETIVKNKATQVLSKL